jgi:small-conductance mechanosensitive channel
MLEKIKNYIKSITLTKTMENRIRRIVELTTFGAGVVLIVISVVKIVVFSGTFTGNMIELTAGLIAIQVAYRGLIEDLPRVGAMITKRRFWE